MARDFNYGAEVVSGGGMVFKNPDVGDHEAIITAIVHVGSIEDHFKKGGKVDVKKPANYVLVCATLMGDEDLNEDGSRMRQWKPIPLKQGDKALMPKFLNAVDPKELLGGFDDFIGEVFTVGMVGDDKGGKNDDGTFKYVNWKTFAGCPEKLKKLVIAQAAEEGIETIGHITFDKLTKEIIDDIPAHMVRQYLLNETENSKNLSVPGSHVEAIIKAAREADPEWKKKKAGEQDATPDNRGSLETGQSVPSSVPAAEDVPPPQMDEGEEY